MAGGPDDNDRGSVSAAGVDDIDLVASADTKVVPRWAKIGLTILLLLFLVQVVLNAVTLFALITRDHQTREQVCHLYVVLHADQIAVVIPPSCRSSP